MNTVEIPRAVGGSGDFFMRFVLLFEQYVGLLAEYWFYLRNRASCLRYKEFVCSKPQFVCSKEKNASRKRPVQKIRKNEKTPETIELTRFRGFSILPLRNFSINVSSTQRSTVR